MITLGINAAFHDSSAALVLDGRVLAAAEEERFTRVKHAKRALPFTAWELPFHSIAWMLRQAGVTLADVDHVAYSFDPTLFARDRAALRVGADATIRVPAGTGDPAGACVEAWDNPWDPLFQAYQLDAPNQLRDGAPFHLTSALWGEGRTRAAHWQWHPVAHHLCHQASAFLCAPFDRCAVMTLDGRGEVATTTYGVFRDHRYRPLGEVTMPDSLGLLYEAATTHLGFLNSSDEYKVMALAALGRPRFADALSAAIRIEGGQFRIAPVDFEAIAGPPRPPRSALLPRHLDLAASLQVVLEATVLRLVRWLREASGEPLLAMAGGVALNCVMNARLRDSGVFDQVWVQPAAGDAGTALGAALWVDGRLRAAQPMAITADSPDALVAPRSFTMEHPYVGPAFEDQEIEALLESAALDHRRFSDDTDLVDHAARLLADGRIVGWFQGAMEWGPRALGARSILASPIDPMMQTRLNELKDREDFRPVAPAVLAEAFGDWFEPAGANGGRSPFMLFTYRVRDERAALIPSACHSDGTARVQTVEATHHPRFHALLASFGRLTGVPILVNTSFNVRGEPIVCTPKDALDAFWTTPLDALVIGRFLLLKPHAARLVRDQPGQAATVAA